MIDRRSFLKCAGLVPFIGTMPRLIWAASEVTTEKADYTLRIGTGLVELAPDHIVSTTLYNGQFPGPLLRFGRRATRQRVRPRHPQCRPRPPLRRRLLRNRVWN